MYKRFATMASKQPFADFANKISARWQQLTEPNSPSKVEEGESVESILADLVGMPTITGNVEAIHEAMDYIADYLKRHGMHVERPVWNGVESLVATTRKTKTPTVFLAGHIDVVGGEGEPFQLRQVDGKLYGRGALDMKSGIAGYLAAIARLGDNIANYDFGVMIMSDEEIGGFDGAQRLAEAGYLPRVMVLPDGGGNWNLERFAKGVWFITLEAMGKTAHGSRPWEGDNAIDTLTQAIAEVRSLFPQHMAADTSTMSVGIISGGNTINQIPSSASASLDIRMASTEDQVRLRQQVLAIADRLGIKVTIEVAADPLINNPANPYLTAYAQITEQIIGRPVEWTTSNTGSDGRYFTARGVPCAIAYPPGGGHHGDDEYISVEALNQFTELVYTYVTHVAGHNHKHQREAE